MGDIEDKVERDIKYAVIEFEQQVDRLSQPKMYRILDPIYNNPLFIGISLLMLSLTALTFLLILIISFTNGMGYLLRNGVCWVFIPFSYTLLCIGFGLHYDRLNKKVNPKKVIF